MPEVTPLKAADFILEKWEPIETFPKNGAICEVQDVNGDVWLARWHADRIVVETDKVVTPLHWRPT